MMAAVGRAGGGRVLVGRRPAGATACDCDTGQLVNADPELAGQLASSGMILLEENPAEVEVEPGKPVTDSIGQLMMFVLPSFDPLVMSGFNLATELRRTTTLRSALKEIGARVPRVPRICRAAARRPAQASPPRSRVRGVHSMRPSLISPEASSGRA